MCVCAVAQGAGHYVWCVYDMLHVAGYVFAAVVYVYKSLACLTSIQISS